MGLTAPGVRLLVMGMIALLAGPLLADAQPRPSGQAQPRNALGALGATAAPRESWEGVSHRLAISLVDPQARAAEEPLFLPRATVRRFGLASLLSPLALHNRFDGWRILGVHSFDYPSDSVAAGIAAMLQGLAERDPKAMPELLRRALSPSPRDLPAAEQTASRWITSALSPQSGDKLAIVLLWDPMRPSRPMFERLSFVMIRAGRLPDGRYRVQAVCHGSAQEALLEGV